MTNLEIVHNKIRCPFCKEAYMQLEFVIPHHNGAEKVDLEIFMSCENTIEKLCSGRMRINANASRIETWESIQQE